MDYDRGKQDLTPLEGPASTDASTAFGKKGAGTAPEKGGENGGGPACQSRQTRCQHVRPDGSRCKASALRGETLCFWHIDNGERAKEAARRGWLISQRRTGEAVGLSIKNPRSTQELTAALALIADSVVKGTLTPSQAKACTEALREIAKVRHDEAVLSELAKLNEALADHEGKGAALLEALGGGE